ncbi:hypothetical protein B0T25DRAFT_454088 [Lasiosphaeria hispida]|uniref:RING-type domain-containing protein n=1 Tax=Lasiosphaeria hispida TaxID=260671 RepID=A0AAJ0MDQ3_9PEZI|nr:hypothetical protein B0T25DRAFT_454088 [Lasiosphaeria hispida]
MPCSELTKQKAIDPPPSADKTTGIYIPEPANSSHSSQAEPSGLAGGDRAACQQAVMSFFPDICPQHFAKVAADFQWCPEQIITHVLDQQEQGIAYPKRGSVLKRKRPDTEVDGEEKKVDHLNHPIGRDSGFIKTYTRATKILLQHSFPQVYVADIDRLMKDNNCMAYASHLAIEKALLNEQPESALKTKKITAVSKGHDVFQALTRHEDEATVAAVAHWTLAKDHCQGRHDKIAAGRQREREELENVSRARAEGTMSECGCCFDSFPLNRMVHCDGQGMHWFCRDCVKRMAENQIGDSKYELACMSMDGCDASFSHEQRSLFLDEKATQALDRIEQESVLRMAGIENLATCPFCPFAAEYPPVEENREFRCLNPECAVVSCRHCRQETHVPKTCEEAAREVGHSARHAIEEAMSQALIRRCNKCTTPFIKEHGCNKMTCTRPGCRNIQCYVCSQSCEYSHFDDAGRGGKNGNCPLFDSVEERHEAEVKEAEDKARKLVAEQNPDISPDMFQIAFSDKVKADEQRRKNDNPGPRMPHAYPPPFMDLNRDNLNLLGARQQLEAARQQLAAQQLAARQQLEAARQQLVAQQQLAAQQLAAQQARQQAAQQARQQAAQQAAEQQAAQHEVAAQRLLAVRQAVFPVEHHHFFYRM